MSSVQLRGGYEEGGLRGGASPTVKGRETGTTLANSGPPNADQRRVSTGEVQPWIKGKEDRGQGQGHPTLAHGRNGAIREGARGQYGGDTAMGEEPEATAEVWPRMWGRLVGFVGGRWIRNIKTLLLQWGGGQILVSLPSVLSLIV